MPKHFSSDFISLTPTQSIEGNMMWCHRITYTRYWPSAFCCTRSHFLYPSTTSFTRSWPSIYHSRFCTHAIPSQKVITVWRIPVSIKLGELIIIEFFWGWESFRRWMWVWKEIKYSIKKFGRKWKVWGSILKIEGVSKVNLGLFRVEKDFSSMLQKKLKE